ncbi:WD40/YVTN/BNR-like repeat-containing protein [Ideonella sp.]|uniref:WD40/YVTN/BNR-like repeat-containing protein n=1 Tax=Ideonella sp. TaxID=1929293 RepID=UPI003BB6D5BA
MNRISMRRRSLLLGWMGLPGLPLAGWAAAPDLDPLTHAAAMHVRATTSVVLALGRAGTRLVAVGERGTILLSDDEGQSWRQTACPVSVSLTGVSFGDDRNGWIVGHGQVVLHSSDGGQNWVRQLDGTQVAQIELSAAKASRDAELIRTAERLVGEGADKPFLDVHFFDANHGLVIGAYGSILATEDGGKTWRSRRAEMPNPGSRHLYRIHRRGEAASPELWLCGEQGLLCRANGREAAFTLVPTPYKGSFFGMASTRATLLVHGLRGNLWRSTDGGASWARVEMPAPVTLTAATVLSDASLVLVDEAGKLLRSTDEGASFTAVSLAKAAAFTDVLPARDGAVVLASARGPLRLAPFAPTAAPAAATPAPASASAGKQTS